MVVILVTDDALVGWIGLIRCTFCGKSTLCELQGAIILEAGPEAISKVCQEATGLVPAQDPLELQLVGRLGLA